MKPCLVLCSLVMTGLLACGSESPCDDLIGGSDIGGDTAALDVVDDGIGGDTARDQESQDVFVDVEEMDTLVEEDVPADAVVDSDVGVDNLCPYPTKTEIEAFDQKGGNDQFADAQPIMMGEDVTGFIGQAGDEDWYAFCPTSDGVVDIHIDFSESYNALGINWMMFAAYTEEWLESNVSVVSSEYDGSCFEMAPINACLTSIDLRMSVTASQGRYAFKLNGYSDGEFYAGFDQQHPYTVRVTEVPGDDLEAEQPAVEGFPDYGSNDTWRDASPVALDQDGVLEVSSFGWYWNDVDWYRFRLDWPGWVRVTASIDWAEDELGNPLVDHNGSIIRMGAAGPEDIEERIEWFTPYNEGCTVNVSEGYVFGGTDYYLRTFSAPGNTSVPYFVRIEYGTGDFESAQPNVAGAIVGAAEEAVNAYDLGDLALGGSLTVSSYSWHSNDWDWYKFTVPEGAAQNATVTWDYTTTYNARGWHSCPDNQDGIENWMYLFEGSDLEFPGVAQGYVDNAPVQTMTWPVVAGQTYHIVVMSREGFDQVNPYTLTVVGSI